MSGSSEDVLAAAAAAIRNAGPVSPAMLRTIVGAVTRLYAKSCESAGLELSPLDSDVPTTEAMMLACGLVRSQNLNSFDFAMWFSTRRADGSS